MASPVPVPPGRDPIRATATAAVLALGSAPPYAAYSVTRHDGAVSVSVYRASGVAGANAALHKMHARVVVVPVRPGCPPVGSLPRPQPAPHPPVCVHYRGERAGAPLPVTVKIKGSIPAGDTMILAFSGNPRTGSVGTGGIITGPVPRCVSLPSAPSGDSGSGPASTAAR